MAKAYVGLLVPGVYEIFDYDLPVELAGKSCAQCRHCAHLDPINAQLIAGLGDWYACKDGTWMKNPSKKICLDFEGKVKTNA